MIVRLVKLTLSSGRIAAFLEYFHASEEAIRSFPGCTELKLFRDEQNATVYFTYSTWKSANALDAYRHSDLFRTTWEKAKTCFSGPPEAWSLISP